MSEPSVVSDLVDGDTAIQIKHRLHEIPELWCQLVLWVHQVPVYLIFFVFQQFVELAVLRNLDLLQFGAIVAWKRQRASNRLENYLSDVEDVRWSEVLEQWQDFLELIQLLILALKLFYEGSNLLEFTAEIAQILDVFKIGQFDLECVWAE